MIPLGVTVGAALRGRPSLRGHSISNDLAINEGVVVGAALRGRPSSRCQSILPTISQSTVGAALRGRLSSRSHSISKHLAINEGMLYGGTPWPPLVTLPVNSSNHLAINCRGGTPWPPLLTGPLNFQLSRNQRRGGHGVPPLQLRADSI